MSQNPPESYNCASGHSINLFTEKHLGTFWEIRASLQNLLLSSSRTSFCSPSTSGGIVSEAYKILAPECGFKTNISYGEHELNSDFGMFATKFIDGLTISDLESILEYAINICLFGDWDCSMVFLQFRDDRGAQLLLPRPRLLYILRRMECGKDPVTRQTKSVTCTPEPSLSAHEYELSIIVDIASRLQVVGSIELSKYGGGGDC